MVNWGKKGSIREYVIGWLITRLILLAVIVFVVWYIMKNPDIIISIVNKINGIKVG